MARGFTNAAANYLSYDSPIISALPMSFSAWIYPVNWTYSNQILSIADNATNTQFFALFGSSSTGYISAYQRGNLAAAAAATTVSATASSWHHCLAVFATNTSRSIYLNGGNKVTDTTNTGTTTGLDNTAISALLRNTPVYNEGDSYLAEIAAWNVALTDAEAAILATGMSPLAVRPQSLVAYWPLIRDTDDDIVGGYSMTPYNTPTVAAHPRVRYPTKVFYPSFTPTSGVTPVSINVSKSADYIQIVTP